MTVSAAESKEDIQIVSTIDLAGQVLTKEKKPLSFYEIFDQVSELKGYSPEKKEKVISQFYTEVNVDGRFLNVGDNLWGLKRWYTIERVEDELTGGAKKKAKKAKEAKKAAKKTKKTAETEKAEKAKLEEELDINVDSIDEVVEEDDLLLKEDEDPLAEELEDVEIDEEELEDDDLLEEDELTIEEDKD